MAERQSLSSFYRFVGSQVGSRFPGLLVGHKTDRLQEQCFRACLLKMPLDLRTAARLLSLPATSPQTKEQTRAVRFWQT